MTMDQDDLPVGRILTRRDAVRLLAASGAAVLVGCKPGERSAGSGATSARVASVGGSASGALPRCVAKPELTVGPYFVDNQLNRSDIRLEPGTTSTTPGAPLRLTFNVQQIANGHCTPLPGAMVDVWQCDAAGEYSAVNDTMVGFNTEGRRFLRGYQVTDANGLARFTTIYPGWYPGRAVHIHFKIRTPATAVATTSGDQVYEFTSQLFFDESLTDRVHAEAPYNAKGRRTLRNERDGIFRQSGGTLMLDVVSVQNGYDTTFDVGLDLSDAAVGRADGMGRGGPGGRRRPPG